MLSDVVMGIAVAWVVGGLTLMIRDIRRDG